ncbi:MAG: threonylcarbamoyl-AMP synthase [Candidatus Diapherotrites archaeon]|nr:threonylcarbamoyl-AMP synthase [Candidatus Diapherotrites archaeon]
MSQLLSNTDAKTAAKLIQEGKVVVYPTETSYGLGALASNAASVHRLIQIKRQPPKKPISVLVSSVKMARKYVYLNATTRRLLRAFGGKKPLTLICPKKPGALKALPGTTLAIRISSHPFARALLRYAKEPITATSANIHGETELFDSTQVLKTFENRIDAAVNAGRLPSKKPSTIFDCTTRQIIRKGPVSGKEIRKAMR